MYCSKEVGVFCGKVLGVYCNKEVGCIVVRMCGIYCRCVLGYCSKGMGAGFYCSKKGLLIDDCRESCGVSTCMKRGFTS